MNKSYSSFALLCAFFVACDAPSDILTVSAVTESASIVINKDTTFLSKDDQMPMLFNLQSSDFCKIEATDKIIYNIK